MKSLPHSCLLPCLDFNFCCSYNIALKAYRPFDGHSAYVNAYDDCPKTNTRRFLYSRTTIAWQTTFKDNCTSHFVYSYCQKFQVLRIRITRLLILSLIVLDSRSALPIDVGLYHWVLDFLAYCFYYETQNEIACLGDFGFLLNSGGGEGGCNRLQTAIALVLHWQLAPKWLSPLTITNLVISAFKARQWPKNWAYILPHTNIFASRKILPLRSMLVGSLGWRSVVFNVPWRHHFLSRQHGVVYQPLVLQCSTNDTIPSGPEFIHKIVVWPGDEVSRAHGLQTTIPTGGVVVYLRQKHRLTVNSAQQIHIISKFVPLAPKP